MNANPFVTWALAPLPSDGRVAVVAGPGADLADVELVDAEITQAIDRRSVHPSAAELIVLVHRGAPPALSDAERGWGHARRVATWSVVDRVVEVTPVASVASARRHGQAAHLLRAATVRARGVRRRWGS